MSNGFGKTAFSLLVMCMVAIGQEQSQSAAKTDCGSHKYIVGQPAVAVFQRYNELPRNRDEDVAIVLFVPVNDLGCCALSNNPKQPGIYPTRFDLQPSPEFTVRFRSGFRYKSHQPGTPIEMAAGDKIVLLKLRANRDTSLGSYILHGKLTYRTLQTAQELEVAIPVKVIADKSKVQEIDWPFGTHVRHDLLRILALPVELPAAALLAIACSKGCDL
ncbi:MAG TPA: hypothetical protein VK699_02095 [Terriglobales bacterium]|nr:hypothetical protein [Terriglobales bacterium]